MNSQIYCAGYDLGSVSVYTGNHRKTEAGISPNGFPKSKYRPLNKGITGRMRSGAPDIEYYGVDGHVEVWVAVRENRGMSWIRR